MENKDKKTDNSAKREEGTDNTVHDEKAGRNNAAPAKEEEEKDKKRRLLLLLLLLLLLFGFVFAIVWAIFFRGTKPVISPDHVPSQIESRAEPIQGDDSSKLDAPSGGGAVSLTYSKAVDIDLSDKRVELMFANPSKSTQDMVLTLVIKDTVIAQSGRLSPGNQVKMLDLAKNSEKLLSEGGYEGKFVVSFYDPQSGERATVNAEIPVTVTVTE